MVLASAAVLVVTASVALAQGWREYISRDEFFLVAMPDTPQIADSTYRAASGAVLPAKTFTVSDGRRRFVATVVHYMNASQADHDGALAHAVATYRARPGQITFDNPLNTDGLDAHTIYHLNADGSRTATGLIFHPRGTGHGGPGRLYILEGHSPVGTPPATQFSQSFFLLDEQGARLDYRDSPDGQLVRNIRGPASLAVYSARPPATCPSMAEPANGKPTTVLAVQYVKCTMEGIGDGHLFLLENVVVREIGEPVTLDAISYDNLDVSKPAYPIKGSLLRYACERENRNMAWGRAVPGKNCATYEEANASGYCYRLTSGNWACSMSDLIQRMTPLVAPPK
jgi:hypothetical protein